MRKSINNSIIDSYNSLYSNPSAAEKVEITSAGSFLNDSAKKGAQPVRVVLCDKGITDFQEFINKKTFSAAFITSGAKLTDGLVSRIKKSMNISVIGLQKYLFDPQLAIKLNSAGAECLRLGEFRNDFTLCEPLLREAEYIFLDMSSVKSADFPIDLNSGNPNGFTSDEICHVARYAGFSCSLKAVFIYGIDEKMPGVCTNLTAQVIWHIVNGIVSNVSEHPEEKPEKKKTSGNFEHKIVTIDGENDTITFLKSRVTGRLWIEIPIVKKEKIAYAPCSEADYQVACKGEVPARWVFYYNKYNIY